MYLAKAVNVLYGKLNKELKLLGFVSRLYSGTRLNVLALDLITTGRFEVIEML